MKNTLAILAAGMIMCSCHNAKEQEQQALMQAQQRSMDSMKLEMAQQYIRDSLNAVMEAERAAKTKADRTVIVTHEHPVEYRSSNESGNAGYSGSQSTTNRKEKKGWSGVAKGAVIGAGVGAVTGAMVHEKKGVGAIIGGVAGAGAGAGVGAIIDKKQKQKEAQQDK